MLYTILDGKRVSVESIDAAVTLWESFRDNHPIYGCAGFSEVGNGIVVFNDNQPIAKVSYNGRVWPV